jgi:hypothetical protein
VWEQRIGEARTNIEMTRLLCLKAAGMMDKVGHKTGEIDFCGLLRNSREHYQRGHEVLSQCSLLVAMKNLGQRYSYGDRDVMLYAYAIGIGADPLDEKELAFVNEATATARPLMVVATFASVAAWGRAARRNESQLREVVDGERDITFQRPLAVRQTSPRIPPSLRCSTRAKTRAP